MGLGRHNQQKLEEGHLGAEGLKFVRNQRRRRTAFDVAQQPLQVDGLVEDVGDQQRVAPAELRQNAPANLVAQRALVHVLALRLVVHVEVDDLLHETADEQRDARADRRGRTL